MNNINPKCMSMEMISELIEDVDKVLSDKELTKMLRGWEIEEEWKDKDEPLYHLSYLQIHPSMRVVEYDGITMDLVGKIIDWVSKKPIGYYEDITLKHITEEELNVKGKGCKRSWGEKYRDDVYRKIMWSEWEDYNPNDYRKMDYPSSLYRTLKPRIEKRLGVK